MAFGDVSPSKLPGPIRRKIIVEDNDTVRNLVEEKPNYSISEVQTAIKFPPKSLPELVNTVEKYAASLNKD